MRRHGSLKEFRESFNPTLSQKTAAAMVGISQSAWYKIETGLCIPRPRLARRLSDISGVPLTRLLNAYYKRRPGERKGAAA